MSNHLQDAGIPVLTEIIPTPAAAPKLAIPVQREAAPAVPVPAAPAWDEHEWNRMEREIRERVLYQILERVDFMLEQRVRDSLADALQIAVERLASDIKTGLQHAIKDTVTQVVSQEIANLHDTKK